jgi:hypothetical protein
MSQTKVIPHALQDAAFPQTRWSLILNAQEDDPAALAELCRAYWYPLYCFARRMAPGTEDAKDLIQAYFEQLLKKETFKYAREERGRLRTFLVTGLRDFRARQLLETALKKLEAIYVKSGRETLFSALLPTLFSG